MKIRSIIIVLLVLFCTESQAQKLSGKEKKSLKRIEKHVQYLASDRLEGRATGTEGEQLSAAYIADAFKKNKLKPKGNREDYFQTFDFVTLRMAKDSCTLMVNGIPYQLFSDFYPVSWSSNKAFVMGLITNVEYGISAPELEYDNYKNKSVAGKVVLIKTGLPDTQQVHSKFASYMSLESRVRTAEKMGAAGIVFINSGNPKDDPSGELSKTIKPSGIPVFFFKHPGRIYVPEADLPVVMRSSIFSVSATGHNVIGFKNNKAPYTVVIGAHHDHLGRGEVKGSRELNSNEIHNGADDNASGTSALIELSKKLKKRKFGKFNYLFIAFSGEEMGLLGSKYFIENPTVDLGTITCMLNMDMVGRLNKTLIINGTGTSPFWNGAIEKLRQDSAVITKIKLTESGIGASDHTSFYLAGIPSLHFFTGQHEEYHKPTDDMATLNLPGEVKVMEKIIILIGLLPANEKLTYTKTKDEGMRSGFKVSLGIMPDYTFDGEGVRIDGVKEGKPAALAGLQKGDIIMSLAGEKIPDIQKYMSILGKMEKGQKVEIIYLRDGKATTSEIQF